MHLDKYLKVLVQQHNLFVAMCEEFPRYTDGQKPEFDRRVVRVITPGTLIDESFLNPFENNFLLAIEANSPPLEPSIEVGLAWIDVSTGEFFTKTIPLEELKDDLARINPREIVLAQQLKDQPLDPIRQLLENEGHFFTYVEPSNTTLRQSGLAYTLNEYVAINLLTTYMQANLLEHMPELSAPKREGLNERMQIDSHTIKALEIHEGAREGGHAGSLLSVIKRTVTGSGMRSLSRRLCLFLFATFLRSAPFQQFLSSGSPSTSQREIEARQSLVAFFYHRPDLRDDTIRSLQDSADACRIVQRFLSCKGEPKDLTAINRTIQVWTTIQNRIQFEKAMEHREQDSVRGEDWSSVDTLLSKITNLHDLSTRITLALEDVEFQASLPDEFAEGDSPESGQKFSSAAYGISKRTIRPE